LTTLKKCSEIDSCDPEKVYVSEWKMKWDCEDNNEENWNDERGSGSDLLEVNQGRMALGRRLHMESKQK
jgi:hypothetical protein